MMEVTRIDVDGLTYLQLREACEVVGSEEELVVFTTRPETSSDPRGLDMRTVPWHGARVWHPFRQCSVSSGQVLPLGSPGDRT